MAGQAQNTAEGGSWGGGWGGGGGWGAGWGASLGSVSSALRTAAAGVTKDVTDLTSSLRDALAEVGSDDEEGTTAAAGQTQPRPPSQVRLLALNVQGDRQPAAGEQPLWLP